MSNPDLILSGLRTALGGAVVSRIQTCRVLLVGAGGIGCELVKNLALTGFERVDVIDLDTIDVSNLNRQLLFRSQHVGMPKCTVACEVAAGLAIAANPQYVAHHGNVCDAAFFNHSFVEQFDVVLNALDNVTARRRVNRMALAAKVPLVEAGTTGYLGQVNVIDKASGVACYECQTQETQKVYPICTIRSTPSAPVHTIVWAKELYKLLFGAEVEESMLFEDTAADGAEPSTYMQAVLEYRALLSLRDGGGGGGTANETDAKTAASTAADAAARSILTLLYATEIQKQLDMDRYKTAAKTPAVLDATILRELPAPPSTALAYRSTDVWSPPECAAEFVSCLKKAVTAKKGAVLLPAFDKDDDGAMKFVTAASNLRNHVFKIEPLQSLYDAKGIAGNIIPAIATTNAICAGLQILQTFHILKKQLETGSKTGGLAECCRYMNCVRNPTRNGLYLTAALLEKPNPKCYVCSASATVPLTLNVDNWTLGEFLDRIVRKDLAFQEPTIMLEGDYIWEEGEDAQTDNFRPNLAKKLADLPGGGIRHGTMVLVEDFSQDLSVQIAIAHRDVWEKEAGEEDADGGDDEADPLKFVIGGEKPVAKKAVGGTNGAAENGDASDNKTGDDDDDDDVVEVVDDSKKKAATSTEDDDDDDVIEIAENGGDRKPAATGSKRPPAAVTENGDSAAASGDDAPPPAKKAKIADSAAEVIEIDD